jgi:hypothetical protein
LPNKGDVACRSALKDPLFMELLSSLTRLEYATAGSVIWSLARLREALKLIELLGPTNSVEMKARTLKKSIS